MARITRHNDAYGLEIWSYFNGGSGLEIVERDDGNIDSANSTGGYFAEFESWDPHEKLGMRFVRGRHALDVGCGAGRVSLYLQKRGMAVVGIDTSPLAVRTCTARGVKNARVLAFEDVGRLPANTFDTVVLLGNNFGLFGNATKAKRILKQIHRITTDRAVVIAGTTDPSKITNRDYRRRNRQRGRMPGQIRIRIRFRWTASPWFDYLFVSPVEMKNILKGTGWKAIRFITGKGREYLAVIEKDRDIRRRPTRRY